MFLIEVFFSRTMPEFHINGRFPFHNSSLENNAIGDSYDTSSSLMVTGRSHNPTTAISTTTNTLDSEYSVCGFVYFIICFCFALAIMIAIGIWLVGKRRIMKTQESQKSNVSIQMEPLSSPIFMQNCNWTKKKTFKWYYYTLIQWNLRKYLTRKIENELCFEYLFFLISRILKQKLSDDVPSLSVL